MNGRRTVVGLCMLCALAFSAIAAQAASASGTTAYTCVGVSPKEGATAGFETAKCTSPTEVGLNVHSEHRTIANGESTELSGSGGTTTLKSVSSGVTLTLQAEEVTGSGTMENSVEGEEMYSHGTGVINYKKVTVIAPAGKGCTVKGGEVTTNNLTATTKAQGMFLHFTPTTGTVFAAFTIEGCSTAALNKEYKAEGSVSGVPTGTETVFTHAETTTQGTLTLGGQKAGINGNLNLTARLNSSEAFTPLAATT